MYLKEIVIRDLQKENNELTLYINNCSPKKPKPLKGKKKRTLSSLSRGHKEVKHQ